MTARSISNFGKISISIYRSELPSALEATRTAETVIGSGGVPETMPVSGSALNHSGPSWR
ncbi:MAG: hypothetical protein ACI9DF_004513, partial [Verrucomicrobiales bacterium]